MHPRHTAFVLISAAYALSAAPNRLLSQLPKDPCAQVTPAQVSSALGMTVGPGQSINSLNTSCQWVATGSTKVRMTAQFQVADTYARIKNSQLPGVQKTPVSGVGDDAFSQTTSFSTTITMLFVRKGKTMLTMRVYGVPDGAKQLAAEKAVAQAIVSKL